mmetsp:Transcript_123529/g.357186  ORF Transcript_123529/g.357186 Transcript_123529/m.357186 type:complete len:295 (+) Transcript_123529:231-1115(+)
MKPASRIIARSNDAQLSSKVLASCMKACLLTTLVMRVSKACSARAQKASWIRSQTCRPAHPCRRSQSHQSNRESQASSYKSPRRPYPSHMPGTLLSRLRNNHWWTPSTLGSCRASCRNRACRGIGHNSPRQPCPPSTPCNLRSPPGNTFSARSSSSSLQSYSPSCASLCSRLRCSVPWAANRSTRACRDTSRNIHSRACSPNTLSMSLELRDNMSELSERVNDFLANLHQVPLGGRFHKVTRTCQICRTCRSCRTCRTCRTSRTSRACQSPPPNVAPSDRRARRPRPKPASAPR